MSKLTVSYARQILLSVLRLIVNDIRVKIVLRIERPEKVVRGARRGHDHDEDNYHVKRQGMTALPRVV